MSRSRLRAFIAARDGITAVEFGFVAIPLMLLLFGTIEFSRLMWTREALRETAIAGARCMGVLQTSCKSSNVYSQTQTTNYITSLAAGWSVPVTSSDIILNANATCAGISNFSQVTINYKFVSAVSSLIGAFANGIPLTVSACFPNQPT